MTFPIPKCMRIWNVYAQFFSQRVCWFALCMQTVFFLHLCRYMKEKVILTVRPLFNFLYHLFSIFLENRKCKFNQGHNRPFPYKQSIPGARARLCAKQYHLLSCSIVELVERSWKKRKWSSLKHPLRVGIGATSSTKKVNRTELIVGAGRLDFVQKKYCFLSYPSM